MMVRRVTVMAGGVLTLLAFSLIPGLGDVLGRPRYIAPHGELRVMVVHVDFPDTPGTRDPVPVFRSQAELTETFYREVSYGKTRYVVDGLTRWVRMPKASGEYGLSQYRKPGTARRGFMADAVAAVDSHVDFRPYHALAVVIPRGSRISCCWSMGSRWGELGETFIMDIPTDDGVTVQRAAIVDETSRITLLHELGHTLGLPDLYSHDVAAAGGARSDVFVGTWDIMSAWPRGARRGPHFLAWSKWLMNWLSEEQIETVGPGASRTVVIEPIADAGGRVQAVRLPLGGPRYYMLEVRQPLGSDVELPSFGLLVTLVDESIGNGKGPVRVINAHPDAQDPAMRDRYGGLWAAPFDLGPGKASRFEDQAAGITVILEGKEGRGYRIAITRR